MLDELKGFAIALVVLYHAGGVLVWQNFLHGDLGVDVFVILSGIGLSLGNSAGQSAATFLRRRLRRILPAYWIALSGFLLLNAFWIRREYSLTNILLHYSGLHAWFGDVYAMSINDSFWFITLILSLYLLYLGMRHIVTAERLLLCGAIISVVVAGIYFQWGQSGVFGHMALRIPGFFLGLLLGRLMREGRLDLSLNSVLMLALLIAVYVPYMRGIVFHTTIAGSVLMGAYAWLLRPALVARGIKAPLRVFKFLGDHSLEIFLLHQPLIRDCNVLVQVRWFGDLQPGPGSLALGMVVAFGITLLLSVELRRTLARFLPT